MFICIFRIISVHAAWFASIRAIPVRETAVSSFIVRENAWTSLVPVLISVTRWTVFSDLDSVLAMASRDSLSMQRCTEADCFSMSSVFSSRDLPYRGPWHRALICFPSRHQQRTAMTVWGCKEDLQPPVSTSHSIISVIATSIAIYSSITSCCIDSSVGNNSQHFSAS